MSSLSSEITAPVPPPGAAKDAPGNIAAPASDPAMNKLRAERDRYVALAFAAGDVLIEIGLDRRIRMVSGACQSLVGRPPGSLLNTDIRDLAEMQDRAFLHRVLDCLSVMGRLDPVPIRLLHASGAKPRVLIGACQLPTFPDRIFMSLTLMPAITGLDEPRDEQTGLLTKDGMLKMAQSSATDPSGPTPRHLSLVRLEGLSSASRTLSQDRAQSLMHEIGAILRAASLGGDTAGRFGDEEFGLIHSGETAVEQLPAAIGKAAKESGLPPNAVGTAVARLDLNVGQLNDSDAARALAYAVNSFADKSADGFKLTSLVGGLPAAMERAVNRFSSLNQLIERGELQLVYQPIVAMATRAVHHYEVLSRFPDGQTPYDTIAFSEEVGLIEDLDLAVFKKALAQIAGPKGPKIAVNLSGRSIQSDAFRSTLENLLKARKSIAGRLMFELTESVAIERLDTSAAFLQWLRAQGHKVCLDDFGSGAAAYSYLRHFDVDYVKIDGPFLKAAGEHPRERALVSSICRLCSELGTATIGEMIETEEDAAAAIATGMEFGQGWLYGKPVSILPGNGPPVGPGWTPPEAGKKR